MLLSSSVHVFGVALALCITPWLGASQPWMSQHCLATPAATISTSYQYYAAPAWIGVGSAWHSTHAAVVEPHAFHALSLCLPKLPVPGPGPRGLGGAAGATALARARRLRRCWRWPRQGDAGVVRRCLPKGTTLQRLSRPRCAALRRVRGAAAERLCGPRRTGRAVGGACFRMVGLEVDYGARMPFEILIPWCGTGVSRTLINSMAPQETS